MFLIKNYSASFILCFSLFLLLEISTLAKENHDDDVQEIEQLVAVDEEEERIQNAEGEDVTVFGSILELNSYNIKTVIENNEFVFIIGYAPWCHGSAKLMSHFSEAAATLKRLGSSILMAKLDCDRHRKAASLLEIKGFPTLIMSVNGSRHLYTGGFSAGDMVIWGRKRTGFPVIRLLNFTDAEGFLKKQSDFAVGIFEKFEGDCYKEFVKAAVSDNDLQFVEVGDVGVAEFLYPNIKFNKTFLGLVKNEPEIYTAYDGTCNVDKILQFLNHNKLPLINVLTELNSPRLHNNHLQLQVMIFTDVKTYKILVESLQNIARKFKTKILFSYVDIKNDNLANPYLILFGLEDSENTVVVAFNNEISSKYLLESDPTPRNIEEFCFRLVHRNISEYFKSQPVPDNELELIKEIVGKTFDGLVLGSDKHVLLEVYTSWCVNCDTTRNQMEKIANHFNESDNILFSRIDASKNEHPKLQLHSFPTLLLYRATHKSKPIKLSAEANFDEMLLIIKGYIGDQNQVVNDEL